MPTPGPLELVIILVIALLILGPGKLPDVGAALGKSIREFRKASSDVQDAVSVKVDTSPLPADARRPVAAAPVRVTGPRPTSASRAVEPAGLRREPAPGGTPDDQPSADSAHRRQLAGASSRPWPTPTPCASRVSPGSGDARSFRTAPLAPAAAPGDETVMSLVDHLGELRTRIFRSILAVGLFSAIGFRSPTAIADPSLLADAIPGDPLLSSPVSGDAFVIQIKISIVVGIILAMPVLLYQVWAFISPGLTPSERRTARPWIPVALFFFAIGTFIAWIVLPFAAQFLFSFESKDLPPA